jgi:hypothetical protein
MGASPGLGSYYEFQNHQVFNGFGACGTGGCGFGAIEFNSSEAWSNWVACSAAWQLGKKVIPQCKDAADLIRAALGQIGYGKLPMGTPWGPADQSAYKQFAADHNLAQTGGMPTKGGLDVIQESIENRKKPGPKPIVETHKVGREFVPGPAPGQQALSAGLGVGGIVAIGLVGLAVVGGIALVRKKKKGGRGGITKISL